MHSNLGIINQQDMIEATAKGDAHVNAKNDNSKADISNGHRLYRANRVGHIQRILTRMCLAMWCSRRWRAMT